MKVSSRLRRDDIERRAFVCEMRAESKDDNILIVRGTPIVYSSETDLGEFREIIEPGALDNANMRDVRLCLNHDTSFVYARSRNNNGNSTMTLEPNENGLAFIAELDGSIPAHRDFYGMIARGDIDAMSFMFTIADADWDEREGEKPLQRITQFGEIFEISAVTFPAYQDTEISARSLSALESVRTAPDGEESKTPDSELVLWKEKNLIYKEF